MVLSLEFLQYITKEETGLILKTIKSEIERESLINPKEINHWTSDTSKDGIYFAEWLKCCITSDYLQNPPDEHPRTNFDVNSHIFNCIQSRLQEFHLLKGTTEVSVLNHYITLRAKTRDGKFPVLSPLAAACASSDMMDVNGDNIVK
ncbi:unnamed protein product [Adineta steineri]|uniref:Uncharacterized protein n=1 Tax=Adineta steineri TaxID=433720 RepID=A0A814QA51_9BILA|nr:unnamed protein product [Adineta steineri]CAF3769944.1 unnamed protein product [Adineta steineri]